MLTLRKEIQRGNEKLRTVLLDLIEQPVSELLPQQLLDKVRGSSPSSLQFLQETRKDLQACLALPAVPDEHIGATFKGDGNALFDPDAILASGLRHAHDQGDFDDIREQMERLRDQGAFEKGISHEEEILSLLRYRFARDTKMLALVAALSGEKPSVDEQGDTTVHGIRIHIDPEKRAEATALLDPQVLKNRTQIKDRVYLVRANGQKFFLKEQKTARHRDVVGDGDVFIPCNDAPTDFRIAKDFEKNGQHAENSISVTWEKPVGFVQLPDGFQFGIFEFQDGLTHSPQQSLTQALQNRFDAHDGAIVEEFGEVSKQCAAPATLARIRAWWERTTFQSWDRIAGQIHEPTPEEFSRVKAYWMQERAEKLKKEVMDRMQYENEDRDGYAFLVDQKKAGLTIVGFDFERFKKKETVAQKATPRAPQLDLDHLFLRDYGLPPCVWDNKRDASITEQLIYFALRCMEKDDDEVPLKA